MNTAVNRARAIRPFIGFPGSPGTASFSTEIMLGRARDRAKLAPPPANTSASKPDLAKQLFPSSSPQQEYDIASWANSKRPHSTAMASARLNKPLMPGAGNSRPSGVRNSPTTSTAAATRINSLVSVCSNAGSFEDRPLCAGQSRSYGTSSSVLVNEDDISDDDTNLLAELNYERPASLLPSMSTSSSNQPSEFQPPSSVPDFAAAGAPPTTSDIPWSSSPQHHMFPPETTDQTMRKRGSPDESAQLVKKRILPESWNRPSKEDADKSNSTGLAFDTPFASGSQLHSNKTESLWDATQSAVNEKRKKLKNQSKTAQANLPPDEEGTVTDDHATKKAISLSSEQKQVLDLVVTHKQSVFFTGPAGTGKSVLMRAIISELRKKWRRDPERLNVTASTGLAACNIGGQTLHSFAGIGLGKEDVPTLVRKIRRNPKAKQRWLRATTLVIDEISMVDGELFDKLSQIARCIRNNGRPFGGIQLVITGDFFQLPPVPDGAKDAKFAFDAATWNTAIDHTIGLTQIFRQKDPEFARMLNEIRLGMISNDTVQTFKDLARPLTFDDGLDVTELFPTRYEVEKSNQLRLDHLSGEQRHFDALDTKHPTVTDKVRDKLLSNMMAPKSIVLKKDAQVMLIKNLDETLVNGSLGKVIGFMAEGDFQMWAEFQSDLEAKSETNTFGAMRTKSAPDFKEYPVVRFSAPDGTHRTILCVPEVWQLDFPTGEVQVARKQLPLILAWALSIHKAQGQTLERVRIDLGKTFEKGQAYVALSRAVSKQGLQVLRFDQKKVMAHHRVIRFYDNLYSAESALKAKKEPSLPELPLMAAKMKAESSAI